MSTSSPVTPVSEMNNTSNPKISLPVFEKSYTSIKRLENSNHTPKMNWRWQITKRPITRDRKMRKDREIVLEQQSKEDLIGATMYLLYTDSDLGKIFGEYCLNHKSVNQPDTTFLPQSYLNQTHQLQQKVRIRPENLKSEENFHIFDRKT